MSESLTSKDRRTALIVFGIFEILAGIFIAGLVPLMVVEQFVQAQQTGTAVNFEYLTITTIFYGAGALILLCLGVGSIKLRRWARALSLIFAWLTLILGLLAIAMMGWGLWPYLFGSFPGLSDEAQKTVFIVALSIVLVILLVMLIGIPLVGILFYGSKHVKATCEAHSPVSWTDACPLPVLAGSIYAVISGISILWLLISRLLFTTKTLTFFEMILLILALLYTALTFLSAWKMYRLAISGWWLQIVVIMIGAVMGVINMIDLGPSWGLQPGSVIELSLWLRFSLVLVPNMLWLGYLLWIRKFFNCRQPEKDPALPGVDNLS